MEVKILGTVYKIEKVSDKDCWPDTDYDGVCDSFAHEIKYIDHSVLDEWQKSSPESLHEADSQVLRHELLHAFLAESGLRDETHKDWAKNEEMIDWLAVQTPKIFELFNELGLL